MKAPVPKRNDDQLDGCTVTLSDKYPTPDEEVPYVVLFPGMTKAEADDRAKEYEAVFNAPPS